MNACRVKLIEQYAVLAKYKATQITQGGFMSYLDEPTSTLEFGIVKSGDNIDVTQGIIALGQGVGPDCNVESCNVTVTGSLTVQGHPVVLSVTPTAGPGIGITGLVSTGPDVVSTVNNTGVLELVAGPGIQLDSSTGVVTITADIPSGNTIATTGTTTSYTASATDEYIGVNSTSPVTITLPIGITGRVYIIKEEHGPGHGKITIAPQAGEQIDNDVNYIIEVKYQSITVVFRAGQWHIV